MRKSKWTYKKCKEESLKFKRKIDFLKENKSAYSAAYTKGWLNDICKHMEISGDKYNRCIYCYEFDDNFVYIGLTCDLKRRNKEHLSKGKNNSGVKNHMELSGLTPQVKQLTNYIEYYKAVITEKEYIKKYEGSGWEILNKNEGGSLGASNIIYTKERCYEIIKNSEYVSDVYKVSGCIITKCKKNGWWVDEIKLLKRNKKENGYWTIDKCLIESDKYSTLQDFIENCAIAYRTLLKNGEIDKISHLNSKKPKGYWNYETCKKESSKYPNRFSFQKGSRGSYKKSYENGWLDDFFN